MISTRTANRLLPHAEAGPLLDLLATIATDHGHLEAQPSDEVLLKLYRRAHLSGAATLISRITSPEVLREIGRLDRRLAIKGALARNRHTPLDVALSLAQLAVRSGKPELGRELLSAQPAPHQVELLLTYTALAGNRLVESLALAMVNSRDVLLIVAATRACPRAERASLILEVCRFTRRMDLLPPGAVASLLELVDDLADVAVSDVIDSLLPDGSSAGHQRATLDRFDCLAVRLRILTLNRRVEDGAPIAELPVPLPRLVRGATGQGLKALASHIAQAQLLVDTDVALVLADAALSRGLHKQLRLTAGAQQVLLHSVDPDVAALHLLRLPTPAAQVEQLAISPQAVIDACKPNRQEFEALLATGLPVAVGLQLAGRLVDQYPGLPEPVRAFILRHGADDLIAELSPEPADLPVLLARQCDVGSLDQALTAILTCGKDVGTTGRREAARQLSGTAFRRWLSLPQSVNAPTPGDVTWVLAHAGHAAELQDVLADGLRSGLASEGWISDALELPLPWGQASGPTALAALTGRLTARLGTDLERWTAALSLLPDWTGTLDELAATSGALLLRH